MTFSPQSQENRASADYRKLYRHAEDLYHAADANRFTDSLAFSEYLQAAEWLVKKKFFNDTLVDSYLKCGILSMSAEKRSGALGFFHLSIRATLDNRLPDSLLFKPYLYAGTVHYNENNLDSAVYYFRKAEIVNEHYEGLNESERLFNKLGALYFETGDYNKSISYFQKALNLVSLRQPLNVFFVINYKNNIATALMKLGRYDEGLEIFRQILLLDKPGDEILYNIANTWFEKGDDAEALQWIRQIRYLKSEKYAGLVKIFIRQKNYDSAHYYLTSARVLNGGHRSKITEGILLKYSGDIHAATGNSTEALMDYQQAIIRLDPAFTDTAIISNPATFSGLQNFVFLFDALIAKGRVLRFSDRHLSDQSLAAYHAALNLARHVEKTYFSDDSRLFLKTRVNQATREAVDICFERYQQTRDTKYLRDAFSMVENNKATVLQAGLKNLKLPEIAGLPVQWISEERNYRTVLARMNIQSATLKDSVGQTILQAKIHDVEVALAALQDKMDQNNVYHELNIYGKAPGLDSLQAQLAGSDDAILSFYYSDSSLICFYITGEKSGFSSVPLKSDLFSEIISLRKELVNPEASGYGFLKSLGVSLFQQLVAPVYNQIKNKRRLIIIPFNEIAYVPFEMLVDPEDHTLLLRKHSISYNYSASFLSKEKHPAVRQYEVLAMAPFYAAQDSVSILPSLPSSKDEIADLPGKKLLGSDANKNQFTQLSTSYPILHLATHAVANDTNLLGSFIEFYGTKKDADTIHRLYEQEIYTLNLKTTRLVILSACETGNGLLVNGEGVMSLSRAFSYAGCESVVTSLWKADEMSTSFITRKLHQYLRKGVPIDEALQKAKVDYLENSSIDDRFKNPAYWANLILIGEYSPIVKSHYQEYWWFGIFLALGILAVTAIKKRTRHRNMPGSHFANDY